MKRHIFILFVVFQLFNSALYSQDGRLSRPSLMPILYNPALSGNFDGLVNVGTGSSWQRNNNNKVAHQFSFVDLHLKRSQNLGLGSVSDPKINNALTDESSKEQNKYVGITLANYSYGKDLFGIYPNKNPINANFFSASVSYNMYLTADHVHSMGFGLQGVFATANLNEQRGAYDKEISGGGFGWADLLVPGTTVRSNPGYIDVNFGTYYRYRVPNVQFEFGVAGYHYTKPKFSLKDPGSDTKVQRARNVVHSSIELTLANEKSLLFRNIFWKEGFLLNSSTTDPYILSTYWNSIELKDNNQLHAVRLTTGIGSRSFETVMPYIEMKFRKAVNVSISYEEPLKLSSTSYLNARRFEIGINWLIR